MPVSMTLRDLQKLQEDNSRFELHVFPENPFTPESLKVTGLKFGFRIEWSPVIGVDGYRVAMTTTNNLSSPDKLSPLIEGDTTLEYAWFVGDVAITRQFSVQSYKRSVTGELLFSNFRYPMVSATSKVDGGAGDSAPAAAPAVSPSGGETSGNPGGVFCVLAGTAITPLTGNYITEQLAAEEWVEVETTNGRRLIAVPGHIVYTESAARPMSAVRIGERLVTDAGLSPVIKRQVLHQAGYKWSVMVSEGNLFWGSTDGDGLGILSHNVKVREADL